MTDERPTFGLLGKSTSTPEERERLRTIKRCSFCGKAQDEVEMLIAAMVPCLICDSCVDLCGEIVAEARAEKANKAE